MAELRYFRDQTGHKVGISGHPVRIISLVPSQSEFLWDLGLQDRIVGITGFCVHPADMFKAVPKIGGTKKLMIDKIRGLEPDLVIGNKEENEQGQIEMLRKEFPVWLSDIKDMENAFDMMKSLGNITGKSQEAETMVQKIKNCFSSLGNPCLRGKRVVYFIWNKPRMVAADSTFIDHILSLCGCRNVFSGLMRYPEISDKELKISDPEIIFLSSEPFPFREKHVRAFSDLCPDAKILLVDGEMFSWYGSRLLKIPAYLNSIRLDA